MQNIFMLAAIFAFSIFNPQLSAAKEGPTIVVGQTVLPEEQEAKPREENEISINFSRLAMAEFKELDATQLNDVQIRSGIYTYSTQMAKILTDAGIDSQTLSVIMENFAVWYGQALVAIYGGGNLQEVIQDYTYKITDVFLKHHLGIPVQSSIVSLTTDNLDAMSRIFKE